MILIGRDRSPFVRRCATLLNLVGASFERNPLSPATEGDELAKFNPLQRIPTLVLDDNEVIIDSSAIVDYILDTYDENQILCPATGEERRATLRVSAIATGAMEKTVATISERGVRPKELVYAPYLEKLFAQIGNALRELERAADGITWFGGATPNLADVNAVVAFDYATIVVPDIPPAAAPVHLAALVERANALEAFSSTRWVEAYPGLDR